MVFIEVLISYSKLLICFTAIGVSLFYIVFRLMSGGMFYYYTRSYDFDGTTKALTHAENMGKKFEPIVKKTQITPLSRTLLVQGMVVGTKKFKRLEIGPIGNEIFFK